MPDSSSPILPPEIILHIALSLGQSDLAQCTRINETWYDCCTSLLWKVIQIFRRKDVDCLDSPEGLVGLIRNAHHTHTLATSQASVAKSSAIRASPPCTTLKTLRYQIRGEQSLWFRLEAQTEAEDLLGYSQVLCRLLSQNPRLRSLTVGGEWFMNAWDVEDINGVLKYIPTAALDRLEIAFDYTSNKQSRNVMVFAQVVLSRTWSPLESPGSKSGASSDVSVKRAFDSKTAGHIRWRNLHARVFVSCPKLTRLDYRSDGEENNTILMHVVMMSSEGWKEVQLCGMQNMEPMAILYDNL
ncbi:hypothetical protein BGZ47_011203 [Haplosporangium gracile]|nr:hypothetical protein BGZ47_011203 [Haplosporangium gracile]